MSRVHSAAATIRVITNNNECTKVLGTLARTYANEHVCIFNLARVALEGHVTLAKMAENSLKF